MFCLPPTSRPSTRATHGCIALGSSFHDRRADAADLIALQRLEHVPVRNDDKTFIELRHQMQRHNIARSIQACFAALRIELLQTVANGDVGTDNEHDI